VAVAVVAPDTVVVVVQVVWLFQLLPNLQLAVSHYLSVVVVLVE
jgi:hypothetical protein